MEDVRIQELEDYDAHLLEASATEVRDHPEPVLVAQFFLGHGREHVQQPLGDEPLAFVITTLPPWPGPDEAVPVPGRWPATSGDEPA